MVAIFAAYVGPAAGVATSLLWTATSLFFTAAGRRIGPTLVNATRLTLAVGFHGVTHLALVGTLWPDISPRQLLFLATSGVIGLSIGDQALLVAFVDIGPRLTMLIMTTSPILAALFGWVALGETLNVIAWLGIALTISGVGWVVLERPEGEITRATPRRARGIVLAFVGAACQAGGLLLSKQGMGHGWLPEDQHLHPQAATLVRMLFAGFGVLPILALHSYRIRKRFTAGLQPTRTGSRRAGLLFSGCGAVVGPYLGVWMSLVAADRAPLGIAQTLCSLAPIFILPVLVVLYRERVSPRAWIGAVIAVAGCAVLFLVPG